MGFYYVSLLSIVPLGIAYGALALLYWVLARATRGMRGRAAVLAVAAPVYLVLPVAEELWIAWNFGQACNVAGTFIHKKVRVEGFYDGTTHWWRQLKESSNYQFVESKDQSSGDLWRVERDGDNVKHFRIDRPTARYHFLNLDPMNGTPWAHKVLRSGSSVVVDTLTDEEIARYIRFARKAPWFYLGLDTPGVGCDAPNRWPYSRGSGLIYREVLISVAGKK